MRQPTEPFCPQLSYIYKLYYNTDHHIYFMKYTINEQ